NVTVRDKLVLKPSFPRFAATGDDFVVPVKVFNNTGADTDVKVSVDTSGHFAVLGAAAKPLTIKNGASAELSFDLRVGTAMGQGELRIRAEGGGETTERRA